jgi:hypothetical protein
VCVARSTSPADRRPASVVSVAIQSNADNRPGLRGGQRAVTLRNKVSYHLKHNIWITTSSGE